MDLLALEPFEHTSVLQHLTAQRERNGLSSSEQLLLDGLISKFRLQNPVVLARLEVFALLDYVRLEPVRLSSVLLRLWEVLG